ncbi:MAG: hypothetical protein A3C49_03090 [Candidatus Doudnabacteria bacterium RIFCSPHIGHO2_02_FULL_42_25]|uniref:Uncharacterized protein n=1 Tax=Candidatus Doudnabacteria bacterium RIFCSPHIGHO2_01_FULL_41_86 TaxID=1817821 RepID=A0A1F5N9S4_9BACT|nr:MAG: hypothetical protein A2717_02685 [Candidatus Doudnabacteria bacterium RIFCSPHIGHO2_01_FULL_41_86]OGE75498.1 MAG: hypothetical protein A3K07_01015 [Candidatus Doudnabacteria bacterium RIFCSPHIGHO2_01_43_10]OGE85455.1 MAG: hypothetical protein A3E28_02255 [Candidatus Doudnabacteria bacterium RIFCSPHIGHO2_12_FULL_42_22]OGE86993.1 MAG: hypothetical protein A3C49_03090 [Candidatus Doudnabacteria bacterium RIFCSPHIGHO2_02_FULL_42_25]OGE92592.1 MAG: hypothetical protein A2895_03245 [Candidatus
MTTKIKIITSGFVSLFFLVLDWVLINSALFGDKPLLFWIWPGLVTAISIAFLTLFGLVNNNRWITYGFGALALVTYLLIFPKAWVVALAGLVFISLMLWFERRIRSEEAVRQHFSIRSVTSAGINVIIYAFLLSLSLNIYYNTSAEFKANPDSFYEALGRSAAKSTRYLGSEGRTGIDLNQTLDQYIRAETVKQNPDFDQIPEEFKQQYLEQAKQDFFRQFNIQIPGDQPLSEVVAQFAVDRVRATAEKNTELFPIIFTLIILALLRTFSFVLRWVATFFTWVIFESLLQLQFFRLSKVAVEVEKLEI